MDEKILIFLLFWWGLSGHALAIWKWKTIWVGICGGNGVPQGNELGRAIALYAFYWELGLDMFMSSYDADIEFLLLLGAMIGITTFADLQAKKLKLKSDDKSS